MVHRLSYGWEYVDDDLNGNHPYKISNVDKSGSLDRAYLYRRRVWMSYRRWCSLFTEDIVNRLINEGSMVYNGNIKMYCFLGWGHGAPEFYVCEDRGPVIDVDWKVEGDGETEPSSPLESE
jgi:hypothetical protein